MSSEQTQYGIDKAMVFFGGFAVPLCGGLALLNAVFYADHPPGRGLNLFAVIWCSLITVWLLHITVGVAMLNDETTGKWWGS